MEASGVKETTERSNSYRAIGLTIHSIDLLRTTYALNDKFINIGYIFTNAAGGPIDLNKINNIIKGGAIKETTEISSIKKPATTHTLHHSHISTLAQLGINLKAMQEHVGHSDYKKI